MATLVDSVVLPPGKTLLQFPKKCSCCDRIYSNLDDFRVNTKFLGFFQHSPQCNDNAPVSKSCEYIFANCMCGSTLIATNTGIE